MLFHEVSNLFVGRSAPIINKSGEFVKNPPASSKKTERDQVLHARIKQRQQP